MPRALGPGRFTPGCAPDTLYSWHPKEKVLALKAKSTPENILPVPFLYTWRTPAGTFGYGDLAIRMKLKPNVHFMMIAAHQRDCDKLPGVKNTIFVAHVNGMFKPVAASEYLVCSPEVIESWSVGRPEFYEEMQREIKWASEHGTEDFDRYSKSTDMPLGEDCILRAVNLDKKDNSLQKLVDNLDLALKMIDEGAGEIFYASGIEKSPERHFSMRNPSYFNPRASGELPFQAAPEPEVKVIKIATKSELERAAIKAVKGIQPKGKKAVFSVDSIHELENSRRVYVTEKKSSCRFEVSYPDVTQELPENPKIVSFSGGKCTVRK